MNLEEDSNPRPHALLSVPMTRRTSVSSKRASPAHPADGNADDDSCPFQLYQTELKYLGVCHLLVQLIALMGKCSEWIVCCFEM